MGGGGTEGQGSVGFQTVEQKHENSAVLNKYRVAGHSSQYVAVKIQEII